LIAVTLQRESTNSVFRLVAKSALAGFLAFLLLAFSALGACPALHQLIHADSTPESQNCVICLLAQGQVDSVAVIPIVFAFAFGLLFLVHAARTEGLLQSDFRLSPSRAPPSSR
jgi:hypothetical protein